MLSTNVSLDQSCIAIIQKMLAARKVKYEPVVAQQNPDTYLEEIEKEEEGGKAKKKWDTSFDSLYVIGDTRVVFHSKEKINAMGFTTMMQSYNADIFVIRNEPSENMLQIIKYWSTLKKQVFHMKQLRVDITAHRLAMPHRVLNKDEKARLFETYKITDPDKQLPAIDSQDPMVKWIGAFPALHEDGEHRREADIVEITRHSDVSGISLYYRIVVEDANIVQ